MFRLPWQLQAVRPALRQADSITQTYLGLILAGSNGDFPREIVDLVQSKQLPGQVQQRLPLHSRAPDGNIKQGIVGENFALQPAERQDSTIDTSPVGAGAGNRISRSSELLAAASMTVQTRRVRSAFATRNSCVSCNRESR